MHRTFGFVLLSLAFSLASQSVFADPPPASKDYWQNANYNGHYVLYDSVSRTYVETVDCKIFWRFTLLAKSMNVVTLYDKSRDMTVQLTYGGMYLKAKGAAGFTFYQKGTFDTRNQFTHVDPHGTYSGALTKLNACQWVEYLAGSHTANWHFVETARNSDNVDLFDASRSLTVRLSKDRMLLKIGNNPFGFFKKGHW